MKYNTHLALGLLGATLLVAATSACAPFTATQAVTGPGCDPVAAKATAHKDHCLRCHGETKQKEGPSYSALAAKYKGSPDAEAHLYEHLTTGDVAKMTDGHTDYHKSIATEKPEKIRNLVRWILGQ